MGSRLHTRINDSGSGLCIMFPQAADEYKCALADASQAIDVVTSSQDDAVFEARLYSDGMAMKPV